MARAGLPETTDWAKAAQGGTTHTGAEPDLNKELTKALSDG